MPRYWLCILSPENYEVVKSNLLWGVSERHKDKLYQIKPHDLLVLYVIGERKIKGIYEVISEPYKEETKIFADDIYPYRVKLKPIKLSDEGIDLKKFIMQLSIFKRKDRFWAGILQGRAMIELTEQDFNKIFRELR